MDMLDKVLEATTGLLKPQKVFLLFNRSSGVLVSWVGWHEPHGIDENLFTIVVEESFNPQTQQVVGRYPDYRIANTADLPQEVGEGYIDGMTTTEITNKYPLEKQINNIAAAVRALAKHMNAESLPELLVLEEQIETIDDLINVGKLRKEGYQEDDSFEYVSNEAFAEEDAARYEGGLGEAIGPRQISAVRR